MKDCLGGSYLVMKSILSFPGESPLLTIEYKNNYMKGLGFIVPERAVSNEPCDPYLYCLSDSYSNVSIFPVVRPHVLGRYFNACHYNI